MLQRTDPHARVDGGYANGNHIQRSHEVGIAIWTQAIQAAGNRCDHTLYVSSRLIAEAANEPWHRVASAQLKRLNRT